MPRSELCPECARYTLGEWRAINNVKKKKCFFVVNVDAKDDMNKIFIVFSFFYTVLWKYVKFFCLMFIYAFNITLEKQLI